MDGKKLLVISDTHGNRPALKAVLSWAKDRMPPNDTICCAAFLGDGAYDLRMAAEAAGFYSEWKLVRGNNDYDSSLPDSAVFDFAGRRFFMCHGHRHSLYGGYHALLAAANSNNADVVLFVHTHVPFQKKAGGILLLNPGSAGSPRSRIGATFAVIECTDGQPLKAEFLGIDAKGEIKKVNI